MDFRLLGLFEVESDGRPVQLVRGRESALLALLLLHADEPLPVDRVVEELWGETAPENARKSVHIYVSRLRKALGASRIETTPGGYLLHVAPDELDIRRFEELARAGDTEEALALWRGEPLSDFRYEAFAQAEARRLEQLRDGLLADRIDARLARGEAQQVVPELESLVAREPLWERPRGELMRALYLAGRQADALELYRATRALLAGELGVEPGPELQRLERAILNHDPELGTPARPPRPLARRRGHVALLVGGLVIAGAAMAAGIVVASQGTAGLAAVQPGAVGAIDPHSGRVVAQIAAGDLPTRLATSNGKLWVLSSGDGTITEIDSAHLRRVATFATGSVPTDVAATPGTLWVGNASPGVASGPLGGAAVPASITRFDSTRNRLGGTSLPHPAGQPLSGRRPGERLLVVGGGDVWALGPTLEPTELDRDGRIVRVVPIQASSLAYGNGALWALSGSTLTRIDPHTGRRTQTIHVQSAFDLGGIAAGGGLLWAISPYEDLLWQIDPGPRRQVQTIRLGYETSTIAYGDGAVWVGNSFDDSLVRVDPRTQKVERIATVPAPQDIAVDTHHVWVTSGSTAGRRGPLSSAACGPVAYGGSGTPNALIASDLALQGGEATLARAAEQTIRLVLQRHHYRAGRFRVGYQSCSDATEAAAGSDAGQCSANASSYALDQTLLGIIGPSDSDCALAEIPLLNRAPHGPLAVISPFNTGPFITRPGAGIAAATTLAEIYAAGPRNYARTIGADHIQVAADAVLAKQLGIHRIGVVFNHGGLLQDQQERWFAYAARRLGTPKVVPILWNGGSQPSLAARVRHAGVGGVFLVSGVVEGSQVNATLATLRRALGSRRPVIVTDWLPPWPSIRPGPGPGPVYASLAGLTTSGQLPSQSRRLLAQLPPALRIPWALAPTAQATEALLGAIAASDGTRPGVVRHLFATNIHGGYAGNTRIDRWGDPQTAPVTIFRLEPEATNATMRPDLQGAVVDRLITPPRTIVPPG